MNRTPWQLWDVPAGQPAEGAAARTRSPCCSLRVHPPASAEHTAVPIVALVQLCHARPKTAVVSFWADHYCVCDRDQCYDKFF